MALTDSKETQMITLSSKLMQKMVTVVPMVPDGVAIGRVPQD